MFRYLSVLGTLVIATVPFAAGFPPASDPQNGCIGLPAAPATPIGTGTVFGTLSYLGGPSTPPLCGGAIEWGSHAAACSTLPMVTGPVSGAFCGPFVLPGESARCSWAPLANKVQTGLVIGFDDALLYDGKVSVTINGEGPLTAPLTPGTWRVTNTGLYPGRVIAYPTSVAGGLLGPGDVNAVACVSP